MNVPSSPENPLTTHIETTSVPSVEPKLGRLILAPELEVRPAKQTIVLSGASGVGKGTIMKRAQEWLKEVEPDEREFSRSWTTRAIRAGETGDEYNFVTVEEFEAHIDAGGFTEYTMFNGNYYGTPMLDPSKKYLVEIEVNGVAQLIDKAEAAGNLDEYEFIYVAPPSSHRLWQQLRERDSEKPMEELKGRFSTFIEQEIPMIRTLPFHVVINDLLEQSVAATQAACLGTYFCPSALSEHLDDLEEEGRKLLVNI